MISSTINVLGYQVFADDLNKIKPHERLVINTLNGHSYTVAKKDHAFNEALHSSDILLPDGASVTLGVQMENGVKIPKIAGYDIFIYLLSQLNDIKGSCFFLGSMQETLDLIEEKIKAEYPHIKVGTYSPPYVQEFSFDQSVEMCTIVNDFRPDVLFVGMTAPKQEKWVHKHKTFLNANIICSIGAVFDFYAGTKKRPADWMIKYNLEWFGRFLAEPKRLFHRYFVSTPSIFIDLFLHKLHFHQSHPLTKHIDNQDHKEIGKVSDLDYNYHYKLLEAQKSNKLEYQKITKSHKN